MSECRQVILLRKYCKPHYLKDIREAIIRGDDPKEIHKLQRLRMKLGLNRPKEEYAELMLRLNDNNKNNEDQLSKIFGIRGTPNEENWPQANRLKDYKAFQNTEAIPLRDLIANASADAVDLMEKMLQLNPNDRISLGEALKHPFLTKNVPSKGQVSYRQH